MQTLSLIHILPLNIEQLNKTAKFLNQVSEYSYSLSRKNIYKEELTQEDLDNLKTLHEYSLQLEEGLQEIADKIDSGELAWQDIKKDTDSDYTRQVDNIAETSFTDIDQNFDEYAGLIYDGAFSEHIELAEKKGLTGNDITEGEAENIVRNIYKDSIENISRNGHITQGNIDVYQFEVKEKDKEEKIYISISKKGGKVVLLSKNRDVIEEKLSREEADQKGKEFLDSIGYTKMCIRDSAYLFNGGRGTGKTSAAKVLARAINCLNPKDGEPCNECEICKEILNGSLTDVVEMDAASNNSVEDIRAIREEVNFLPTKAKYRVYIIDEVHMLSTGAFNALLKTLEEPPEHVKFILATTEPQKLPATILSRCQRFDFRCV